MEAGKKTEIAMGDCIRSDIERVGEIFGKNDRKKESETADGERKKKRQWKRKSWSTHPWQQ